MRVVAEKLAFTYNKKSPFAKRALKEVSLTIEEGAFLGVVGHTGSGKSTFILHLNTLLKVQEGALYMGDIVLSPTVKKKRKVKYLENKGLIKKVGMVFQYPEHQLFAETVFEDVAFGVRNFYPEYTAEEVKNSVIDALSLVGLDYEEIKDKSPFLISGGQKRRVAIAGVIAVKPEVLVLDEPCAGLDPAGKTEFWALLKKLHKSFAKTIIVVSHDMNDVCENCEEVALFDGGKIEFSGKVKDLFTDKNRAAIERSGLELPVTAYIANELGLNIDDYTIEGFADEVCKLTIPN